jgi:hypothetical protein
VQFDVGVPADLERRLSECYAIVDTSPSAAALLARTLLQQILRAYLDIPPKRLYDEINSFLECFKPDQALKEALHAVRELGNVAAHPETGSIDITHNQAVLLVKVVEALVREYIEAPAKHRRILDDLKATFDRYAQGDEEGEAQQ